MKKTQFGMFCVAMGIAAFAVWQRLNQTDEAGAHRGEVIFSNTPHPTEG